MHQSKPGIKQFVATRSAIIILQNDGILLCDDYPIATQVNRIDIWKDFIIYETKEGLFIKSITSRITSKFNGLYFLNAFWKTNDASYIIKEEKGNDVICKIDTNGVLSETPWLESFLLMFLNDGILCLNKNILSKRNFENTASIWLNNFNVLLNSENTRLVGNMISNKNLLFACLTDTNKSSLFCINSSSGKIQNVIADFGGYLSLFDESIYIANPYNVRMLNVNTLEVTTIELNNILEPRGWNMTWNTFAVQGNNFYFVHQQAGGGDEAIVGIIDLTKKELLWHTSIPIEEGSYWVSDIQVNGNKLFVLTQGGTLHVFEQD